MFFSSGWKFSHFQAAVVEDYLLRTLKAISRTADVMGERANQPIRANFIALYAMQTFPCAAFLHLSFCWLMACCLINSRITCRIIFRFLSVTRKTRVAVRYTPGFKLHAAFVRYLIGAH